MINAEKEQIKIELMAAALKGITDHLGTTRGARLRAKLSTNSGCIKVQVPSDHGDRGTFFFEIKITSPTS